MRLTLILASSLLWCGAPAMAQPPTVPPAIIEQGGFAAPDFALTDLDGKPGALAEARGHWAFVHFWASWCGPCRREMPTIQALRDQLKDTGWRIFLINTAEDEDTVFDFLATVTPDMSSLLDRDGQATEAWSPRGLPATYLVDPQGRVRYQALGDRDWSQKAYVDFLRRLEQGR